MLKDAMLRYGNVSALAMMQHKKDSIKYNVLISIISIFSISGANLLFFLELFSFFSDIFPYI
jgi:hypothetical protein